MIRAAWHALAKRELFEAEDFYEGRAIGLGSIFLDCVERAVLLIRRHPQAGSPVGAGFRHTRVPQFPYSLIYRVEEHRIFILAVAHDKRRPRYWAKRL